MSLRRYYRPLVYWVQRRYRGWDDSDTWSLDCTMARLMLPRLQRLRKIGKPAVGPSSVFLPKGFCFHGCTKEEERDAWNLAEQKQNKAYDEIEYFLDRLASGGAECSITDKLAEKGRRNLMRYIHTMWW